MNLLELPHQLSKRPLKIVRDRRVDGEGDLLVHLAGGHSEELSSELETYRGQRLDSPRAVTVGALPAQGALETGPGPFAGQLN